MKRVNWTKIVPQEMAENCFWIKVKEEKFENPDLFAQLSQCFSSQSKVQLANSAPGKTGGFCEGSSGSFLVPASCFSDTQAGYVTR
ncbi:hypothetical protein CesoFtcFv8_009923 [Champsocephalus esox]|uniref:Uncharacterized protein n=1 Tax=Champsocephalus esox TaxID=159716 RepID=A0AAN8GZL8_9TELE|nr:hypothetical protein CesoFtcFv8_009923 [Champsocephalus esox]